MSSSEQQGVGRPSRARQGTQPSQDNEAPNLLQYRLAPRTVPGSDEAGEPGGGGVLTPHTSSNSGLPGQEGLDRTAMDIQQFARGGDLVQAQDGAEEEEIEVDESEEGGVSSIVSSSEQQGGGRPSRARQVITWEEESSSGTSSSSPQRQNPVVHSHK